MKKLALLIAVVCWVLNLAPGAAQAHTGDSYHNARFMFPDDGSLDASRWSIGTHGFRASDFFDSSNKLDRIDDAVNESGGHDSTAFTFDRNLGDFTNAGINWEAGVFGSYSDVCGVEDDWQSIYGGNGIIVADFNWTHSHTVLASTGACDTDNNGTLDFFVLALNLDDFDGNDWAWGLSENTTEKADGQGIITHELLHAAGFQSHWDDGVLVNQNTGACALAQFTRDTMCSQTNANNLDHSSYDYRTLEHDDIQEITECYFDGDSTC